MGLKELLSLCRWMKRGCGQPVVGVLYIPVFWHCWLSNRKDIPSIPLFFKGFLLEQCQKKTSGTVLPRFMLKMAITVVQPLIVCVSDYVRLLDLNGRVKTARRHHSVVDMQFEFRIEALGNNSSLWIVIFSRFVTFIFALHKQQLVTTVVGWFVLDKVLDLSTAVETSPTSGRLDLQNFWLAYSLTLSAFLPWLAIAAVAGILSSYDADVFCCAEPLFMPRFVSCECNEFQYFFFFWPTTADGVWLIWTGLYFTLLPLKNNMIFDRFVPTQCFISDWYCLDTLKERTYYFIIIIKFDKAVTAVFESCCYLL